MFILATDLHEDVTVTNAAKATSYRKVRIYCFNPSILFNITRLVEMYCFVIIVKALIR